MRKIVIAAAVVLAVAGAAPRAEEPKRPWTDTAEFSLVSTSGNTKTTTFSFGNKYIYAWQKADLTVNALALYSDSTKFNDATNQEETETTAETYGLDAKYRRDITDRLLWYGLGSWYQNKPSGIKSRTRGGVGVGYKFVNTDVHKLFGELGADYTDETQVGPPEDSASFAGARGYLGYEGKLSETAKCNLELEILENLDETSDYRANFLGSLTASLTSKLALKASYRVAYDNEPAVGTRGTPPTLYEFDKTDTIFSVSLVVNF